MLETDLTYWIYTSYVVMGVFVLGALAVVARGQIVIAIIVGGVGYGAMEFTQTMDEKRYFDIALLTQSGDVITPDLRPNEVGGMYTFPSSETVIMRRGEGERGTFILNNTDQYAVMSSVHYFALGVKAPADEILAVVGPGEYQYVPWRTNYMSSLDNESVPPEEIELAEGIRLATRYWVTWLDFEPALGPIE